MHHQIKTTAYTYSVYKAYGLVSEGQKCEPFSAPLHTIVPLNTAGSDGEEEGDEEDDRALEVPETGLDDTEDFAPIVLNLREGVLAFFVFLCS